MIRTTLNVPEQVRKNVDKYFAQSNALRNYEPIAVGHVNGEDDYLYMVLARQIRGGKWAVWTCWNESTNSLNFGHYEMHEWEAMRLFLDPYHGNRPTEDRLCEIASKCMDGLREDDETSALIYLRDEVELTEEECEYFGVDYDEMQEV